MDIDRINTQLEWRDIQIVPQYQDTGQRPFVGQVHIDHPEIVRGTLAEQFQSACLSSGIGKEFLFAVRSAAADRLFGVFVPKVWLEEKVREWFSLSRYVRFLVVPMEKETAPTDGLSKSYAVMQQYDILVQGKVGAEKINEALHELNNKADHSPIILDEEGAKSLDDLLDLNDFDAMMRYCIKELPEYSGSELEQRGESLWKEWQELKDRVAS